MTEEELSELRAYKPAEVARLLNMPVTRLETWVRTAAVALHSSLEDLGQVLSEQFVTADGRLDEILDAYAVDHGHRQATS